MKRLLKLSFLSLLMTVRAETREDSVDFLDALVSISRNDDLKCVPRILCEIAAGSLGKQSSNLINNFDVNSILSLITNSDALSDSPILNFGKATFLGYTNKGNPETCYRAYRRCPRDPMRLIYYLNNHNGGFFRFFRKRNYGNYRSYSDRRYNNGFLSTGKSQVPFTRLETDRTGTGELKFDVELPANRGRIFFPREFSTDSQKRIVFPDEKLDDFKYENKEEVERSVRFFPDNFVDE